MPRCERCGAENRTGAQYCGGCGEKYPKPEGEIGTLAGLATIVIAILACGLMLAVIFGVVYFFIWLGK
jgi:hypothetical protein